MIGPEPTRDLSVWEGMRLLRGAPGTTVKLVVLRGNAAEPHEIELTREATPQASPVARLLQPKVGYVRVAEFAGDAAAALRRAAAQLQREGAKALVLDVRGTARERSRPASSRPAVRAGRHPRDTGVAQRGPAHRERGIGRTARSRCRWRC